MTLYAHVTGSTVDSVGQPPALVYEAGRWWDLRPLTPAVLNPRGWFAVTPTARPADTDTTTTDYSVTLVGGVPTETWTTRPWTTDELAARARQAVAATLTADTTSYLTKLRAAIDALAVLLADDTTTGSIRQIMGPSGATAGTGSLRALKAQTNTNVVNAASIKGFIDQVINLAQRSIDGDQATRRVARQTLRLAKAMVGDYSSADVGADTP